MALFPKLSHALTSVIVSMMFGASPLSAGSTIDTSNAMIVVDQLIHAEPLTRGAVEGVLHTGLIGDAGTGPFNSFTAASVRIARHITASIEFRAPTPGGSAVVGSMLILEFKGACIDAKSLQQRFMTGTNTAWYPMNRHHGGADASVFQARTSWGLIGFEIPWQSHNCLRNLVLRANPVEWRGKIVGQY